MKRKRKEKEKKISLKEGEMGPGEEVGSIGEIGKGFGLGVALLVEIEDVQHPP
jgi:hypothetical protein